MLIYAVSFQENEYHVGVVLQCTLSVHKSRQMHLELEVDLRKDYIFTKGFLMNSTKVKTILFLQPPKEVKYM